MDQNNRSENLPGRNGNPNLEKPKTPTYKTEAQTYHLIPSNLYCTEDFQKIKSPNIQVYAATCSAEEVEVE